MQLEYIYIYGTHGCNGSEGIQKEEENGKGNSDFQRFSIVSPIFTPPVFPINLFYHTQQPTEATFFKRRENL